MAYGVQHSADLERILRLPTRSWQDGIGGEYGTAEQLVETLSEYFRRPGSSARLRKAQAVSLAECADFWGLFGPIPVGGGKTLLALLLSLVCEAQRPVLLVPAKHREKTRNAWDEYAEDWRLPGIDVRGLRDGTRPPTFSAWHIRIVSGGQTGADRGGLDAALALGLAHGGYCPAGRRAEDGRIPERYSLTETLSANYAIRTEKNVVHSDATLVVGRGYLSGGSALTFKIASMHGKPIRYVDLDEDRPGLVDDIRSWVRDHVPERGALNLAGPRESKTPGIQRDIEYLLRYVLGPPVLVVESYERVSSGSFDRSYLDHLRAGRSLKTKEARIRRYENAARAFNIAHGVGTEILADGRRAVTIEPATVSEDGLVRVRTNIGHVLLEQATIETDPLETLRPDLVVCDEVHALANPKSAVTRRVRRALEESVKSGTPTRFAGLSGTVTKRSLRDYAHLAKWALGDMSPLPHSWSALAEWAGCLDEGVEAFARLQPGALCRLVADDRQPFLLQDPLTEVRRGFARRLESTPGVVAVRGRGCQSALEVELVRYEVRDQTLLDAVSRFRSAWTLPDGRPVADALEYARHLRELSCGFFYRWAEEPPEKWAEARRAWRAFVGRSLNQRIDTELQVANACARGQLDSGGAYEDWRAIRDEYRLVTEAVWVSEEVLRALVSRVESSGLPTLVWSQHVAVLEKLGEVTGWPVFGAGRGADLEQYVRSGDGHAVVSVNACADGFNLQARSVSIVLGWPRSGKVSEQLIGRTHREGQRSDLVRAEAFCSTAEAAEDLNLAWADARYVQDTTGSEQKLLIADKIGWNPLARTKSA